MLYSQSKCVLASVVGAAVLLSGCNQVGNRSFDSPQACYDAAVKAVEEENYQAALSCMTPESHDTLAGSMVMMAVFVGGIGEVFGGMGGEDSSANAMLEVLNKHGLDKEKLAELNKQGPLGAPAQLGADANSQTPAGPDAMLNQLKQLGAAIKDKPAFIVDMLKASEEMDGGESPLQGLVGELTDVKIEGDKATGKIKSKNGSTEPIVFRKQATGWLISMEM